MCYDGALVDSKPAGWTYFAHPDEFVGLDAFAAGVDVWARGDFGGNGNRSVDHTFRVRHASVPAHAEYLQTPTIIKVAPLAPANFGHFLGNALYPAFVAAWRLFGARAASTPLQVLFAGVNQTDTGDGAPLRALAGRGRRAPAMARPAAHGTQSSSRNSFRSCCRLSAQNPHCGKASYRVSPRSDPASCFAPNWSLAPETSGFRQSTDSTVALGATRRSYCGPTSWNTQVRAFSPRGCHQAVGGRPSVLRS